MIQDQKIGSISFIQGNSNILSLSYFLSKEYRDQGIMTKALQMALESFKNHRIKASVESNRYESIRVLLKNNFIITNEDQSCVELQKSV